MEQVFKAKINQLRSSPSMSGKKVLSLIVLFCISVGLNASTIHWITFVNTDDPKVGECGKNARNILYERFVKVVNNELSQYGYDCKFYDYYSGNYTPQDCKNCIENLQCDTADIVIFYHIGHGTRISKDTEHVKYPLIFIEDEIRQGIPLSWVHKSLKEKNARLTFSISIASNRYIGAEGETDIAEASLPSVQNCEDTEGIDSRYKSVIADAFLGYKGDMIVCAASPEQCSQVTQTPFGSLDVFTYAFVSLFEGGMLDNSFTWPKFLSKISDATTEITNDTPLGVQTPICDYDLKRVYESGK